MWHQRQNFGGVFPDDPPTHTLFLLSELQEGFTDEFNTELDQSGEYIVPSRSEADGFFINTKKLDENYVYLDPLSISAEFSFVSGLAGLDPSPDWFTSFYMFNTLKESADTFWDRFKLRTYPWDAGTDDGTSYEDSDRDSDPAGLIRRIELGDTVNDIFLSPGKDEILYLAEWECILHVCPVEEPDCEKEDWPPANGCDVLKYPECAEQCVPNVDEKCEQCRRESQNEELVYHKDCCLAGRVPKDGRKCENGVGGIGSGAFTWTVGMTFYTMVLALML